MSTTARDLRLVPVAAATWGGAALGIGLPAVSTVLSLGLWALSVALLAGAALASRAHRRDRSRDRSRRWRFSGAALALTAVAVALAAATVSNAALAQPARQAASALDIDGGRAIEVVARMTGKAESSADRLRFDAVATEIGIGGTTHAVDVPIVVRSPDARVPGLDVGAQVRVSGTAFRAGAGEREVLVVDASGGIEVTEPPAGLLAAAAGLRHGLVDAVAGLPEPGAGLVPGLSVGDTSAVGADLDRAMKSSSLSHLTAVSGANCAIVVGLAFVAASFCGARRGVRVAVSLVVLGGFVLLVTPEPSVVRAAVMAAIAMLGVALGRTGAGLSLLCLAVAASLVADPWLAASLGFALSVAATGALLVLTRPLATGLGRWMPRPLALALAVPLAAQLACGPLLIVVAPSVPLYGVVANLLAGPAAPAATIIGLAACLALPLPWLASGLAALAWVPAAWIAATAQTLSALPGGTVPWLPGAAGAVALALVGAAVGVLITGGPTGRLRRIVRTASGALLALVVGVTTGLGALTTVAASLTLPTGWAVLACDIGQGDAVLVRSAGRVALIDTGPDPARLSTCLSRVGVTHIDLLVLTHFDLDHVGGTGAVIGRATTVLHGPPDGAGDQRLLDRLAAGGAHLVAAHAGMAGTLGDAAWRVVWPRARSVAFPSGNDASVTVDIRGGGVPPAIFLGDLGASAQRAVAASDDLRPPYTVVKVSHHGSADQDAGLYAVLRPAVAIISVGVDNDYGHPRAETLALLSGLGATIGRTDRDGVLAIAETPDGVTFWRERAPPGTPEEEHAGGVGLGG